VGADIGAVDDRLRQQPGERDLCTGNPSALQPRRRRITRRRRASDLGACEFLAKPVDFDALKAQLRQLAAST